MAQNLTQKDILFRNFQIHKYRTEGILPTVTMTVTADITRMLELRAIANSEERYSTHITMTHLITKAAADTLKNYRLLFSFFTGREIIENQELVIGIPVDVEQHVEYIVLHNPDCKDLSLIAEESTCELNKIRDGNGTFYQVMKELTENPGSMAADPIEFCRQHLGNFPISNFGSFHVDSGTIAIAQPIISGICIGSAKPSAYWESGIWHECTLLPITISFDHRPVDGAYAGRFLAGLRKTLEKPEQLFDKN
jgi:pyruvate/2-oxoglutarate dehydrogenase complex dihydrolipoamide acyltransferase (E2) component